MGTLNLEDDGSYRAGWTDTADRILGALSDEDDDDDGAAGVLAAI